MRPSRRRARRTRPSRYQTRTRTPPGHCRRTTPLSVSSRLISQCFDTQHTHPRLVLIVPFPMWQRTSSRARHAASSNAPTPRIVPLFPHGLRKPNCLADLCIFDRTHDLVDHGSTLALTPFYHCVLRSSRDTRLTSTPLAIIDFIIRPTTRKSDSLLCVHSLSRKGIHDVHQRRFCLVAADHPLISAVCVVP